jgi:gliding motility-associated-like protein
LLEAQRQAFIAGKRDQFPIPVRAHVFRMKKLVVVLTLGFVTSLVVAQTPALPRTQSVSASQWEMLKQQGKLNNGDYVLRKTNTNPVPLRITSSQVASYVPLNCTGLVPIDSTFTIVPFQTGSPPDYRNDDGSSPAITLPFVFCFYGQIQTQCYINNNGNVSFGSSYGAFSAATFPSTAYVMIAPFWADIDTRNLLSGVVYYQLTATHLIVRWNNVGYYSQHANLVNDFQLVITDGTDPILPAGANVGMSYGDMQWTTGDASGGVNGFGGTPATVGCNVGDGINYIQLGTFGQAGGTYNGPFGPASGIDWLDNKQFFLDACSTGGGGNIPPVMNAPLVCDTITICVGDTVPITAQFLSPEMNQSTTVTASASGTGLINQVSTPGNIGSYSAEFVGLNSNIGVNMILLDGTDNGTPAQSTTGKIYINVIPGPTASFSSIGICPGGSMPFTDLSTTPSANGPITGYHWDFGMSSLTNDTSNINNPSYVYNTPGVYQVTLLVTDSTGCKDTAQQNVRVYYLPQVNFSGTPTSGCAPLCVNFTDLSTVQNSSAAHWVWHFGDGSTDTLQNPTYCYPNNGNYAVTLTVTSAEGCSYTDSLQNYIHVIPGPIAAFSYSPQTVTISNPTINFTDLSTNNPGNWYWDFGVNGQSSTLQNPTFVYPDTGYFNVMLIASANGGSCPDTAYATVFVSPELLIWIPNAFTPNNDLKNDLFLPVFSDPTYVVSYSMMIFDRWGNLIFSTEDPLLGWDGRTKNTRAEVDTYVFRISVKGTDNIPHKYVGHVNLIR